jgi:uncharacterized protein with von Willebrand factor type A (vWA) domain
MDIPQSRSSNETDLETLDEIHYFLVQLRDDDYARAKSRQKFNIRKAELDKLLRLIGREALRERTPDLQELAQIMENMESNENPLRRDKTIPTESQYERHTSNSRPPSMSGGESIITELIERGYLKDSQKWLTRRGFSTIGEKILMDIMNPLTSGESGSHETIVQGLGSLVLDTTRKFEYGNDLRLLNVSTSLLNAVQRNARHNRQFELPLRINIDDMEEYETSQDVRVSVVYCIDLSSTMRYSSMFGDLSRIEAAKKALWGLFLFNKKFFPSDSISVIGFGALASPIPAGDIPYLKTFEPGADFMHYTNYQAAFRLASKILIKEGLPNKRIVLITDGHPSACFIDHQKDRDELLSQKPYSHFYSPDVETLQKVKNDQNLSLDLHSGKLVYLCYRYRQVDEYIAQRTVAEAKKCYRNKIHIDTIMISEEDSLLTYVNHMEKTVNGKSYYINPGNMDRALLTDYVKNRRAIVKS